MIWRQNVEVERLKELLMILVVIAKFWRNLAWISPSETWNHIKIFTKLGGSFKNQVPFENDCRPGICYDSIARVRKSVFPCIRTILSSWGRDDVESLKNSHFFSTIIGRNRPEDFYPRKTVINHLLWFDFKTVLHH